MGAKNHSILTFELLKATQLRVYCVRSSWGDFEISYQKDNHFLPQYDKCLCDKELGQL